MGFESAKFDMWQFQPPGPVCAAYIQSEGPIDLIRGPWGSGKTVGTVFKVVRHGSNLFPVCRDSSPKYPHGVIHVRCAAIRDTYREMAKTALASWHEFFPKNGRYTRQPARENYSGGQDRPVKHVLEWDTMRMVPHVRGQWVQAQVPVVFEMEFGAIGEMNLDSFFKGYEISIGWMNECDLLSKEVPGRFYGRTGRYPPRIEVQPWEAHRLGVERDEESGIEVIRLPRIICGDFNPPDEANWTYKCEIEEPDEWPDYHFFAQPSGLSPQAENRRAKTRSDYEKEERQFGGPQAADAVRNVHGQYAAKTEGKVVYPNFSLYRHRSDQRLEPVRDLPFYMGFDAGGTPACGIGQFMPNGQFRGLREIVSEVGTITGAKRFALKVMEVLLSDFRGMRCGGAWGDPSAWYGADQEAGELPFMLRVAKALQVNIRPTATNDISSRIEAVEFYFGDIDARTPRSLWDPRLKHTIRGFVSQYHLTKQASEGKTDRTVIAKNEYSHIQDAWQYLLYGYRGPQELDKEAQKLGRANNIVPITASVTVRSDFDVFEV